VDWLHLFNAVTEAVQHSHRQSLESVVVYQLKLIILQNFANKVKLLSLHLLMLITH